MMRQRAGLPSNILLIDPDPAASRCIRLWLSETCRLVHAAAAREGIVQLQQGEFDALLVEQRLPDSSGLDLIQTAKALAPRVPIIMITASGSESTCAAALRLGVFDYLIKPFHPTELAATVDRAIGTASTPTIARATGAAGGQDLASAALDWRVLHALRLLERSYWRRISLGEIAREVALSRSALSRKFSASLRLSFRSYLLRLRVKKAEELLANSSYSIAEVAERVGFGDLTRFDKAFMRVTTCTPSHFRRRVRRYGARPATESGESAAHDLVWGGSRHG